MPAVFDRRFDLPESLHVGAMSFQCVIFYSLSPFLEEHHRLVWTPDPSGRTRKGLGNNLARKRLECWNAIVFKSC